MFLSESRAVITQEALSKWAALIQEVISQPDIAPAFLDPRRIWNMVSSNDYNNCQALVPIPILNPNLKSKGPIRTWADTRITWATHPPGVCYNQL